MKDEFEIISHANTQYLNIFIVRLVSRTIHIHRDLELGIVLDGSLSLKTCAQPYTIGSGDAYLINSMEAHEFSSREGALILAIQFAPAPFDSFIPGDEAVRFSVEPPIKQYYSPEAYDLFLALCSALAQEYIRGGNGYRCLAMVSTLYSRLLETIPFQYLSHMEHLPMQRRSERLISVTDYIDAHFTRKLLLEEIAQREGLSLFHLSHLFKDALGVSFQDYLKQKRFENACSLLASTDKSVLEISMESGFSDVRYLNDLFRKEYGCTPSEYRAGLDPGVRKEEYLSESIQLFLSREDSLTVLDDFLRDRCSRADIRFIQRLFGTFPA